MKYMKLFFKCIGTFLLSIPLGYLYLLISRDISLNPSKEDWIAFLVSGIIGFIIVFIIEFIRIKKEPSIQIMQEYIENKIAMEEFFEIYKKDKIMQKLIYKDITKYNDYLETFPNEVLGFNDLKDYSNRNFNIDYKKHKYLLYAVIKKYILRNIRIPNPKNNYEINLNFYNQIIPNWLNLDSEYIDKILKFAPKGMSQKKKVTWCRNKLKEIFKYDEKPPIWIKNIKWPIIEEKPLVFNKQEEVIVGEERMYYYFYDDNTKEETKIIQFY